MAIRRENFGKSLEEFEVAKLIKKYNDLGYQIKHRRLPKLFRPDLHMINSKTRDEIIFEIKSKYSYNEQTFSDIERQRAHCSHYFPNARFVLVLAKEEKSISFKSKTIKTLLFDLIKSDYKEEFNKIYTKMNIEFEEVDYFECSNVDFGDFTSIELEGHGNIIFWIEVDEDNFKGKRLTDGTPFYFKIKIKHQQDKNTLYQIDKQSSVIKFDFS